MDLKQRTANFRGGSWVHLADRTGMDTAVTVTLDLATFVKATHFPNGYLPAGVVLGKITATGKYGPYDNAAGDGRTVAAGLLLDRVPVIATNEAGSIIGALQWRAHVVEASLPIAGGVAGGIDAGGKTDLGINFRFA